MMNIYQKVQNSDSQLVGHDPKVGRGPLPGGKKKKKSKRYIFLSLFRNWTVFISLFVCKSTGE